MPMSKDFFKKRVRIQSENLNKSQTQSTNTYHSDPNLKNEKEKVPDSYNLNPDITWVSFCKTILSLFLTHSLWFCKLRLVLVKGSLRRQSK